MPSKGDLVISRVHDKAGTPAVIIPSGVGIVLRVWDDEGRYFAEVLCGGSVGIYPLVSLRTIGVADAAD